MAFSTQPLAITPCITAPAALLPPYPPPLPSPIQHSHTASHDVNDEFPSTSAFANGTNGAVDGASTNVQNATRSSPSLGYNGHNGTDLPKSGDLRVELDGNGGKYSSPSRTGDVESPGDDGGDGGKGGGKQQLLDPIREEERLHLSFRGIEGFVPVGFSRPGLMQRLAGRVRHPHEGVKSKERQIMFDLSGEFVRVRVCLCVSNIVGKA